MPIPIAPFVVIVRGAHDRRDLGRHWLARLRGAVAHSVDRVLESDACKARCLGRAALNSILDRGTPSGHSLASAQLDC
jgi:hypothetical protein